MLIRTHPASVIHGDTTYSARICGEERVDGTWEGWLEFEPTDSSQPTLVTERETSQSTFPHLNTGPMGLSPSILKVHSPVLRDGCSELTRSPGLTVNRASYVKRHAISCCASCEPPAPSGPRRHGGASRVGLSSANDNCDREKLREYLSRTRGQCRPRNPAR